MTNLKDLMKEALAKKQAEQQGPGKKTKLDKGAVGRDQVASHKPAKKSAGRGR